MKLEILRVSDGRLVVDDYDSLGGDRETIIYMWTRGNYRCDCNRALFSGDYNGCSDEEFDNIPCGDGGFLVRLTDLDGTVLVDEIGERA